MTTRLSCLARLLGGFAMALALGMILSPAPATAEDPAPETAAPAETEAEPTATAANLSLAGEGLVIYRDPETGRFTSNPTDAQRAALRQAIAHDMAQALSRSSEGLTEVVLPNGGVMVNLEGRFQSASYLLRGEDGETHAACTHDLETLSTQLSGTAEADAAPAKVETDRHGRAIQ